MHSLFSGPRLRAFLVGIAALTLSGWAWAEPPARVARLSYLGGTVSFSPAGQPDWVQAGVNRPLTTGDGLWADANSRAELQVGGAMIRLGSATSVTLLNLDDQIVQVRLSQGTLKVRVRFMGPNQVFEVDTPNLALTLRRPGEYRVEVDPNGDATAVMVQSGQVEVYGQGVSYGVDPQQGYRFYGTGLSDYEPLLVRREDDLDRWAHDRDRRADSSLSARYVSPDVVGYEDLDSGGTWGADPEYGSVWTPTHVAADWAPYHDGHWAWVDPWGWTWVDDAPWGFAVSHYGRWANIRGSWGWVPGPPREQAVYAPALVAFVGGGNYQASRSGGGSAGVVVGWFPLAPREVYQPSYAVSRGYFENINRSNAVIAPTTITRVYNTTTNVSNNTTNVNVNQVVYVNQQVAGAVVAVPAKAFVQSQPVGRTALKWSREAAVGAPVGNVAIVAPVPQSVHGGAPAANARPPAHEHTVVAHTAPPQPPVAFSSQQQQLAAKPGTPIDEAQRRQLKPTTSPAPRVNVVTTAQAPAPTAPPPATPPATAPATAAAGKPTDARNPARTDPARGESGKVEAANPNPHNPNPNPNPNPTPTPNPNPNPNPNAETLKADVARPPAARTDAARPDAMKAEAARADAMKAEVARPPAARADTARPEAMKAEAARADALKAEAARADSMKAEVARPPTARADTARPDAVKADAARPPAARTDAARPDAMKAEAARADAMKAEAARADAVKAEAARADAARADAARAAAGRADAARAEAARADAMRAEAGRADAARADAARAAALNADAARAAAGRADAARAEAMKVEPARAAPARNEPPRVDAAKAGVVRPEPARGMPPKADAAKTEEEKRKAEEEARKR